MSRPCVGVFTAVIFILIGLFGAAPFLSAQSGDEGNGAPGTEASPQAEPVSAETSLDESAMLLEETPDAPGTESASSIFVVLRMVLVLALAALAIYGVVFFIKRLSRPRESRDPNLKVLARVPLSNETFAAVVSVGAKAWLVGGGSGGVNLISEIDDTEALETMLLEDARRSAGAENRFADLRAVFRRLAKARGGDDSGPGSSHAENLRRQRERLGGQ